MWLDMAFISTPLSSNLSYVYTNVTIGTAWNNDYESYVVSCLFMGFFYSIIILVNIQNKWICIYDMCQHLFGPTYSDWSLGSNTFWIACYYQLMHYYIHDLHQASPSSPLRGNAWLSTLLWHIFLIRYNGLCNIWSLQIVILSRDLNQREVYYRVCTSHHLDHECISIHYVNDHI